MDEEQTWYPYEGGVTIGKPGPLGGHVTRDEEWGDPEEPEDADARLTLEAVAGGYAVTANLYGGWLQETARFTDEAAALAAHEATREELTRLAALIPDEEDRDLVGAVAHLNREVAVFVARFGGEPTI